MDWRKLLFPPNEIEFCLKPWKLPVLFLAASVLVTFFWAFYLMGLSIDEFEFDDYSISSMPFGVQQPAGHMRGGIPVLRPVALTTDGFERLKNHVSPAIVHIHGSSLTGDGRLPQVLSSGVVIHPSGYVVTTYHDILDRQSVFVDVKTPDGIKRYQASIVHASERRDLALLKLKTKDRFLYLKLAQGVSPVGTPVYGFGLGMQSQVVGGKGHLNKRGVVTQVGHQSLSRLFATDAINSWEQSGGALINSNIELEGIGLAVMDGSGRVSGYAIPAHIIIKEFKGKVRLTQSQPVLSGMSDNRRVQGAVFAQGEAVLGRNIVATDAGVQSAATSVKSDTEHLGGFQLSGYSLQSVVSLALLGLVAGVVGGMMTMGGGIIMVTGMFVFFGYGMFLIRPVAFITNVFTYGASSLLNRSSGLVMWGKVKSLTPWAIAGVLLGYALGSSLNDKLIGYMLGVFALLMASKVLHELYHKIEDVAVVYHATGSAESQSGRKQIPMDDLLDTFDDKSASRQSTGKDLIQNGLLGLPMGLMSGLLGISGGVIEVPLQRYIAGISLHNAIANSSVLVLWTSLSAAIVSLLHGTAIGAFEWQTPIGLALIMIPSSYLGGMLGARLLKHVSVDLLNWIYASLMLLVGVKMLFGQ